MGAIVSLHSTLTVQEGATGSIRRVKEVILTRDLKNGKREGGRGFIFSNYKKKKAGTEAPNGAGQLEVGMT